MRNLWNLPLQRLSIYCQPFERPGGYYKVSPQASCNGPDWIGLERHFAIIEETIPFRILKQKDVLSVLWHHVHGPTHAIDQDVCVLIDYLNVRTNYFHWFLDALPRIFAAEAYGRLSGRPFRILTPASLKPWQWDSLMFLGVKPEQLLDGGSCSVARSWSFERLITSFSHRHLRHSPTGHFDSFSPEAIQTLSSRLIAGSQAQQEKNEASRRLYISRGNVGLRRVNNEQTVMEFLAPYGFEMVTLDNLPLALQIQVFRQATHVISAHGGALTNLLYVSPGCQVLEIFQAGHGVRPDFFQLSALGGALYSFCSAESLNSKNDIDIPIAVLRTFLEASL